MHQCLCIWISVFIFVHCSQPKHKAMKVYLMEFFRAGKEGIIYRPLLSVKASFKNLDECIEESERIKTKYDFHLCKITE